MVYDDLLETKFYAVVAERVTLLTEQLANITAIPDYATYCLRAGEIAALRDLVPELFEAAREQANKR